MSLQASLKKRLSPRMLLWAHLARAMAAAARYGFPARRMLVFGITGTKGKTTACHFLASILEEAGFTVGMTTTVDFQIGDRKWTNNTNKSVLPPEHLQKLLRDMKEARCNAVIVEVTSHSIDQHRIWGIPFRYVGLTNITHDHLDYHKTWAHYQATKLKLFLGKRLKGMAVNADDPSAELFLASTPAGRRWSYGLDDWQPFSRETDRLRAEKISTNPNGASFTLRTEDESARVRLHTPGAFNIENALCAAALALNLNLKLGTVVAGLEKMERVPGRLEKIETKKGFTVMVDYAHTPDSLEKLYSTLRPDVRGRMIAVLGATGDRDRTKRPIMGALAARFCDYVFVTDEEPYTEDPREIMEEVAKGVPRGRPLFKPHPSAKRLEEERPLFKKSENGENDWWWMIDDRREAIQKAISLCRMDDLVLVTGMGAQNYKTVGHEKVPWNDRQIIEDILREKNLL